MSIYRNEIWQDAAKAHYNHIETWQDDAVIHSEPNWHLNFDFFKIQDGDSRNLQIKI